MVKQRNMLCRIYMLEWRIYEPKGDWKEKAEHWWPDVEKNGKTYITTCGADRDWETYSIH